MKGTAYIIQYEYKRKNWTFYKLIFKLLIFDAFCMLRTQGSIFRKTVVCTVMVLCVLQTSVHTLLPIILLILIFLLCFVLIIVRVSYCVCLWCTWCYPNWGFSVLFSSVVRQMPGYNSSKTGHGQHFPN
jgi:hypothetical protein